MEEKKVTLEDRNKEIEKRIKDDFEDNEDESLKREYRTGFKNCWNWLKSEGIIK